MSSFANSLAGLALLSGGGNTFATMAALPKFETMAQRRARAAFTTPQTTPPWKAEPVKTPISAQATAIKAMRTIIDRPDAATLALPKDVQTNFTAYKALDRLRVLAETAAKPTTSSAERAAMQTGFARGLADLKTYLASAPSELVQLAFADADRNVTTVGVDGPSALSLDRIPGRGVVTKRDDPLPGMTGSEVLKVTLSALGGAVDTVTVDLSTIVQPPTLDRVAEALNAAIADVPKRDASGNPMLDADGKVVPAWGSVKFEPTKPDEKWGLSLKRAGYETVTLDQVDGADALMVANGVADGKDPVTTRLSKFADPTGEMVRSTIGTIAAIDKLGTERLEITAEATKSDVDKTPAEKAAAAKEPKTVYAATLSSGIVTDREGFGYVVGTTSGMLGGNGAEGDAGGDLVLTKLNSEGGVVWQRALGAPGTASGTAITIAPDGGIVVAGTVEGTFDGVSSDGDMIVARFDATGNETFSTIVREVGAQAATAVAVGTDGAIYLGGTAARDKGDALLIKFDAAGKMVARRTIATVSGTETVRALAIDADGSLLALTGEGGDSVLRRIDRQAIGTDMATLNLGKSDARVIAVGADGAIAVAGSTDQRLAAADATTFAEVNGPGASRDGFVARIASDLTDVSVTYIASASVDEVDSVAFLGDDLYVGGRTSGTLGEKKTGTVDAFVARIDAASGTIGQVRQFGTVDAVSDPVRLAAVAGGDSAVAALGLHRGTLTPTDSVTLEAQTSLRAGDEFSIRVNGGAVRKIVIQKDDTLTKLANRIRLLTGTRLVNVTTPIVEDGRALRIAPQPGNSVTFIAGAKGRDALAKLGLDAQRIVAPASTSGTAPKVTPGGNFGLDLTEALAIDSKDSAKAALARITQAISFTQSAYRSLYWDDVKAMQADPKKSGGKAGSTAVIQGQMANYQAALARLSTPSTGF